MGVFNRNKKDKPKLKKLPDALVSPSVNPVNYNSVLDYLVGLSAADYDKICKITTIYREAHAKAAEVLGVEDKPTKILKPETPSDDEIEDGLDTALNADLDFLSEDSEPEVTPLVKEQAPSSETKIDIKG